MSGSAGARSSACSTRAGLSVTCPLLPQSDLSPSCRLCAVSLPGNPDHAETEHVLHGPASGEGGVRHVLPGGGALPQLLLALPHRLLSFRESLPDFLQVSRSDGGGPEPRTAVSPCDLGAGRVLATAVIPQDSLMFRGCERVRRLSS